MTRCFVENIFFRLERLKFDRSGIRTHAHIRVPEYSAEQLLESGALDRSAILPLLQYVTGVWQISIQAIVI